MIKVHHLERSRSGRIVWLLEELGEPYEITPYKRNPQTMRAEAPLKALHPLGRAPVIEDGTIMLAESGAIIEWLIERYGNGGLAPPRGTAAYADYLHWMHFAEGSAAPWIVMRLIGGFSGGLPPTIDGFVGPEITKTLDYISAALERRDYLVGEFSGADVQMLHIVGLARMLGATETYPNLVAYETRLQTRPAFQRAIERGGPVI